MHVLYNFIVVVVVSINLCHVSFILNLLEDLGREEFVLPFTINWD